MGWDHGETNSQCALEIGGPITSGRRHRVDIFDVSERGRKLKAAPLPNSITSSLLFGTNPYN